jgi:hypothetical protein
MSGIVLKLPVSRTCHDTLLALRRVAVEALAHQYKCCELTTSEMKCKLVSLSLLDLVVS